MEMEDFVVQEEESSMKNINETTRHIPKTDLKWADVKGLLHRKRSIL